MRSASKNQAEALDPKGSEATLDFERDFFDPHAYDDFEFVPESVIPVPKSHPERHHRWMAAYVRGEPNDRLAKRLALGWQIAEFKDYPELSYLANDGERAGQLRFGGLILAYHHPGWVRKREEYFAKRAADQAAAEQERAAKVFSFPREHVTAVNKTEVTYGPGNFDLDV